MDNVCTTSRSAAGRRWQSRGAPIPRMPPPEWAAPRGSGKGAFPPLSVSPLKTVPLAPVLSGPESGPSSESVPGHSCAVRGPRPLQGGNRSRGRCRLRRGGGQAARPSAFAGSAAVTVTVTVTGWRRAGLLLTPRVCGSRVLTRRERRRCSQADSEQAASLLVTPRCGPISALVLPLASKVVLFRDSADGDRSLCKNVKSKPGRGPALSPLTVDGKDGR